MTDKIEDVFSGYGVEVSLSSPDSFLKIRETLTRIGVASKKDQTLYQSSHILHKKGRYAIVHFKELFNLDMKQSDISDNDLERRNATTILLQDWGLLTILDPTKVANRAPMSQIKIVSYKDKINWNLVPKYSIGSKKDNESTDSKH